MKQIGIIGVGHLGSAILQGLILSQYVTPQDVFISGGKSGKTQQIAKDLGCRFCLTNRDVVEQTDIIILAVIPRILPSVLEKIEPYLSGNQMIISTAASFTMAQIQEILTSHQAIIRAIPNIPSRVCQGMTAISPAKQVTNEQLKIVKQLFMAIGKIAIVDESKLDISSTIAGCSPAYVALFIEALADAGVLAGLTREEAYLMSKQAVLGSASVLLAQSMLPAELKDGVCTPGGTTIRGIAQLEKYGLRNAVIEAVKASAKIKA